MLKGSDKRMLIIRKKMNSSTRWPVAHISMCSSKIGFSVFSRLDDQSCAEHDYLFLIDQLAQQLTGPSSQL